ncbi:MAG: hypothetical protein KDK08_02310 [Rhizobiaceae bacterium]|nr:hypothetical protein [Rhizobiaceae bacterium]
MNSSMSVLQAPGGNDGSLSVPAGHELEGPVLQFMPASLLIELLQRPQQVFGHLVLSITACEAKNLEYALGQFIITRGHMVPPFTSCQDQASAFHSLEGQGGGQTASNAIP